ncbi:MAG: RNA polymerase sigma factor [Betaproteobacteria bacterium]|nr:RNA polymerase sigma factor [Betaproteobacteria bacterium]PWB63452.1 MAG: RNA polymerase subunit sigma-70 [Betaproteobacteria bacterium]
MPPWNMQPELTLFARMRQGDEAAFAALYRMHKDAVYRFALLRTGSAAQAADVAQETFLHLMTRPEQYDPARGSIAAWLCGVARNLARRETASREDATDPEALAADAPATPELVDADCPAEKLLASETAEQVRAALAAVAPHYRDVLVLCELSDLSYAEAAQVCGIDIGTVRSRLSRGRAQLALQLSRLGLMDGAVRTKEAK